MPGKYVWIFATLRLTSSIRLDDLSLFVSFRMTCKQTCLKQSYCALPLLIASFSLHAENGCNGRAFAALTLPNGEIVFGGDFTECNGAPFNRIVRYNPGTNRWLPLGTRGRGVNESVYSLVWYQHSLVVGGAFTRAGDKKALGIARWNPLSNQWQAFESTDKMFNGTGGQSGKGPVIALEVNGNLLYAGGQFNQMVDTKTPSKIAVFNGNSWSNVGDNLGNVGTLYAIKAFNGKLYVGGELMPNVNQLAQFDGSSWSALAFGVNGSVLRLAVFANELIAVGRFSRSCSNPPGSPMGCGSSSSVLTGNIARWDGSNFQIVNPVTLSGSVQGSLNSIALSGLYASPSRLMTGGLINGSLPGAIGSKFFGIGVTNSFAGVWTAPATVPDSKIGGLFSYCSQGTERLGYAVSFAESNGSLFVAGDFAGAGAPVADTANPLSFCMPGQPVGVNARNVARLVDGNLKPEWQPISGTSDEDFLFGDGFDE